MSFIHNRALNFVSADRRWKVKLAGALFR